MAMDESYTACDCTDACELASSRSCTASTYWKSVADVAEGRLDAMLGASEVDTKAPCG